MTPYQILKQEAQRQQLPRAYETDLTEHDKKQLRPRKEQPKRFVWILREHGTWLITEPGFFEAHIIDYCKDHEHPETTHFYTFDNGRLTETTADKCFDFSWHNTSQAARNIAAVIGTEAIRHLLRQNWDRYTIRQQMDINSRRHYDAGRKEHGRAWQELKVYWFGEART